MLVSLRGRADIFTDPIRLRRRLVNHFTRAYEIRRLSYSEQHGNIDLTSQVMKNTWELRFLEIANRFANLGPLDVRSYCAALVDCCGSQRWDREFNFGNSSDIRTFRFDAEATIIASFSIYPMTISSLSEDVSLGSQLMSLSARSCAAIARINFKNEIILVENNRTPAVMSMMASVYRIQTVWATPNAILAGESNSTLEVRLLSGFEVPGASAEGDGIVVYSSHNSRLCVF